MSARLDDQRSFFEANKRFHDVIAWSSGNPLFGYLSDSLLGIIDGTVLGIDYPKHRRLAILKAHEEIYRVLNDRDEDRAESLMREHIDAYVRFAKRKYPQLLDEVIAWDKLQQ
jgi:GntR family transcriptional regulator, transcriptional repressor for pyruvate dehydrogenase complex